jgi:hypothetical protein
MLGIIIMKKSTLYGFIWGAWLGGGLAYLGAGLLTLNFWLIFLPVVIFVSLERIAYHDEN